MPGGERYLARYAQRQTAEAINGHADLVSWQVLQPYLVALAIGLLLGFERERSHNGTMSAGSRSFALLSLLGAIAATFGPWAVIAGLLGVVVLMALAYFRSSTDDPGTPRRSPRWSPICSVRWLPPGRRWQCHSRSSSSHYCCPGTGFTALPGTS